MVDCFDCSLIMELLFINAIITTTGDMEEEEEEEEGEEEEVGVHVQSQDSLKILILQP